MGVVKTQFGYHIIKVIDKQSPKKQTLEEAKPLISQFLEQQKMNAVLEKWAMQKKEVAQIDIEDKYNPDQASTPQELDTRSLKPQAPAPKTDAGKE